MMDFKICEFTIDYVEKALELLRLSYERERKIIPFLPEFTQTADKTGELKWFASEKLGFCAVKDDELLGFFCYYPPFQGVYNTVKEFGSWSPLHAHAVKEMDEKQTEKVWCRLVQSAMERANKEGTFYHSVTLFRHETILKEILSMYGFGCRCADSMLEVSAYKTAPSKPSEEIKIRQTCKEDFPALRSLRRELSYHLSKSPCFCIHNENRFEEHISERENNEDLVTFGLCNSDDELIGFIDTIEGDGENFISQGQNILNICGMYLMDQYRGKGLAQLLVNAAVEESKNLGKTLLGVDYETMNPTARGFWEKYFTPYTISLVRRIDVGI